MIFCNCTEEKVNKQTGGKKSRDLIRKYEIKQLYSFM